MKVTTSLKAMIYRSEFFTVCDEMKPELVHTEKDPKFDGSDSVHVEWIVTNPKDYTKQQMLQLYNLSSRIEKWVYSYTANGEDSILIKFDKPIKKEQ